MIDIPKVLLPVWYSADESKKTDKDVRRITAEDAEYIEPLVRKMVVYCRQHDGVGLAAPQVGIYVKLAISLTTPGKVHVLINPKITRFWGRDLREREGCISIPPFEKNKVWVIRPEIVHLECGTIEEPDSKVETTHSGMDARVIQHEVDHLNMTFITDRCNEFDRKPMMRKLIVARRDYERRIDDLIQDRKALAGIK